MRTVKPFQPHKALTSSVRDIAMLKDDENRFQRVFSAPELAYKNESINQLGDFLLLILEAMRQYKTQSGSNVSISSNSTVIRNSITNIVNNYRAVLSTSAPREISLLVERIGNAFSGGNEPDGAELSLLVERLESGIDSVGITNHSANANLGILEGVKLGETTISSLKKNFSLIFGGNNASVKSALSFYDNSGVSEYSLASSVLSQADYALSSSFPVDVSNTFANSFSAMSNSFSRALSESSYFKDLLTNQSVRYTSSLSTNISSSNVLHEKLSFTADSYNTLAYNITSRISENENSYSPLYSGKNSVNKETHYTTAETVYGVNTSQEYILSSELSVENENTESAANTTAYTENSYESTTNLKKVTNESDSYITPIRSYISELAHSFSNYINSLNASSITEKQLYHTSKGYNLMSNTIDISEAQAFPVLFNRSLIKNDNRAVLSEENVIGSSLFEGQESFYYETIHRLFPKTMFNITRDLHDFNSAGNIYLLKMFDSLFVDKSANAQYNESSRNEPTFSSKMLEYSLDNYTENADVFAKNGTIFYESSAHYNDLLSQYKRSSYGFASSHLLYVNNQNDVTTNQQLTVKSDVLFSENHQANTDLTNENLLNKQAAFITDKFLHLTNAFSRVNENTTAYLNTFMLNLLTKNSNDTAINHSSAEFIEEIKATVHNTVTENKNILAANYFNSLLKNTSNSIKQTYLFFLSAKATAPYRPSPVPERTDYTTLNERDYLTQNGDLSNNVTLAYKSQLTSKRTVNGNEALFFNALDMGKSLAYSVNQLNQDQRLSSTVISLFNNKREIKAPYSLNAHNPLSYTQSDSFSSSSELSAEYTQNQQVSMTDEQKISQYLSKNHNSRNKTDLFVISDSLDMANSIREVWNNNNSLLSETHKYGDENYVYLNVKKQDSLKLITHNSHAFSQFFTAKAVNELIHKDEFTIAEDSTASMRSLIDKQIHLFAIENNTPLNSYGFNSTFELNKQNVLSTNAPDSFFNYKAVADVLSKNIAFDYGNSNLMYSTENRDTNENTEVYKSNLLYSATFQPKTSSNTRMKFISEQTNASSSIVRLFSLFDKSTNAYLVNAKNVSAVKDFIRKNSFIDSEFTSLLSRSYGYSDNKHLLQADNFNIIKSGDSLTANVLIDRSLNTQKALNEADSVTNERISAHVDINNENILNSNIYEQHTHKYDNRKDTLNASNSVAPISNRLYDYHNNFPVDYTLNATSSYDILSNKLTYSATNFMKAINSKYVMSTTSFAANNGNNITDLSSEWKLNVKEKNSLKNSFFSNVDDESFNKNDIAVTSDIKQETRKSSVDLHRIFGDAYGFSIEAVDYRSEVQQHFLLSGSNNISKNPQRNRLYSNTAPYIDDSTSSSFLRTNVYHLSNKAIFPIEFNDKYSMSTKRDIIERLKHSNSFSAFSPSYSKLTGTSGVLSENSDMVYITAAEPKQEIDKTSNKSAEAHSFDAASAPNTELNEIFPTEKTERLIDRKLREFTERELSGLRENVMLREEVIAESVLDKLEDRIKINSRIRGR